MHGSFPGLTTKETTRQNVGGQGDLDTHAFSHKTEATHSAMNQAAVAMAAMESQMMELRALAAGAYR